MGLGSEAHEFVREWLAAWNAHDLEAIMARVADDAVFTSPFAAELLPESGGRLVGKAAIGGYWRLGLDRIPDLHHELVAAYVGVDCVVINYRSHVGRCVCDVLFLKDGRVTQGAGTYTD